MLCGGGGLGWDERRGKAMGQKEAHLAARPQHSTAPSSSSAQLNRGDGNSNIGTIKNLQRQLAVSASRATPHQNETQ